MEMVDWIEMTDELGPEKIVHVYDPESGMRGVVVVDTTMTEVAGGGTRMMPDITTQEIFGLARAMTYKFSILDLPIGGAKAGIWADPGIKGEQREQIMKAFGKAVKPLLTSGVNLAADIGTHADDVNCFYAAADLPSGSTGLAVQEIDGEPIENHATGYGVVASTSAACDVLDIDLEKCSVAIEGFGKVGGGVAYYMNHSNARVAAISTLNGTLYNPDGLDVGKLLELRKEWGDRVVEKYQPGKLLAKEDIFELPVDILIPGARPYVINKDNADKVKAKIISSIANIPITDEAEAMLFKKGIYAIPDFISNAGGVVVTLVDLLGGTPDDVFASIDHMLKPLTRDIISEAIEKSVIPTHLAIEKATEKVMSARKSTVTPSFEEFFEGLKKRLNMQ
jgi:glutamate dehydrogenase/leucine dehydrogenase